MDTVYGKYENSKNPTERILIECNVKSLPVDIFLIANKYEINIMRNKDAGAILGGKLGATLFCNGKPIIVYDDKLDTETKLITIAHEVGHIVLGHPLKDGMLARTFSLTDPRIEKAANIFAQRLLAPFPVLLGLGLRTAEEIASTCSIPIDIARDRAKKIESYGKNSYIQFSPIEKNVYEQFRGFVESRAG
ncbi:MAG: ImmA/IrrE family metallo-endopeptidase [Clostridiales bacterium]|nr:ImmA/IrrE family metallo-endopeptidase [Clostridiales bacterium]